jgi:hypothetical protein
VLVCEVVAKVVGGWWCGRGLESGDYASSRQFLELDF